MDRNDENPYSPPQSGLIGAGQIDSIPRARLESAHSGLRRSLVSLLLYVVVVTHALFFSPEREIIGGFAWLLAWLIGLSGLARIWAAVETVLPLRILIFIAALYPPLAMLSQLVYSIVGARFIRMYGEPLSLFGRRKPIIDAV